MTTGEIKMVRGACPHDCPDTCATWTEVRDGVAVSFKGDAEHPITQGWLCAKVRPYLDRVYHPDRLKYPLRRVGPKGSGEWQRISWDDALAEIADRWKGIIAESGPEAILPYSYSGTLGLLQNSVSVTRLFNRMGASGLERTICDAAAGVAVETTIGARWAMDSRDLKYSKLIVIWGNNPASTGPHFMPFLRQAQKAGAYVVVIDPRRTVTARSADQHIQPNPATDAALALGLMNVIFTEGLHDEGWLEANSVGWRELRERAAEYPVERASAITGVDSEVIVELARRYATTKPALLKFADGIQRHGNGGQTVRALLCLPAIVGQYGVKGGGLFYSTSGWVSWDADATTHAADSPPVPRIVNMVRIGAALTGEVIDPPIRSMYVLNANPVTSTPNSGLIIEGMKREDLFTVVHDIFMTDTAQYADIVLPATTQLEQVDLHKGYGHRFLQFNHQAIEPLAEARSNWDTMRALAAAMDYDDWWLRQEPLEVIEEIFEATKAYNPLLEGITVERLMADGTVPLNFDVVSPTPFEDLHFPTPSGKVELYCEAMTTHRQDPLPVYAPPSEFVGVERGSKLVLMSAAAHHFVSSSLANIPKLMRLEGTPSIDLNPIDAAERGISHGEDVIVENARGWCRLRAVVTEDVPPGVAVSVKGQWSRLAPGGRNVNFVTSDALADLGNQSTFHSNLVDVRPAEPSDVEAMRWELVPAD